MSADNTEAALTVFENAIAGEDPMNPFHTDTKVQIQNLQLSTVSMLTGSILKVGGIDSTVTSMLPGSVIPPVDVGKLPLIKQSISLASDMLSAFLLGSINVVIHNVSDVQKPQLGAGGVPDNTPGIMHSAITLKTVVDPRKYIVNAGDTLESIAEKKNLDSWVPLQMVNRLTAPYNLVEGQVLDLCYRHKVAASETIFEIARKYGLTHTELYPMNPHLFDSQYIFAGQEVCIMPAMKRIMCGSRV
jgi:LysM repeat protein